MPTLPYIHSQKYVFFITILISSLFYNPTDSGAVQLTQQNIDMTLASNELVFINFYADWCRFSNILMPVFDESADAVAKEFPGVGKIVMGKVDCDKENTIATRFHITKYPTLKVIRNGQPAKREYRGQRSVDAFTTFIKNQLEDPIKEFTELKELGQLESNKRIIIGYFDRRDQQEYNIFRRVATNLKDDCQFHVGFEEASRQMHPPGQPIIVFRPDKDRSNDLDETYPGSLTNFDELHIWISEKCVPLVREITFENAEELTEEGLPFLILFHASDDKESIKRFNEIVQTDLLSEKHSTEILQSIIDAQNTPGKNGNNSYTTQLDDMSMKHNEHTDVSDTQESDNRLILTNHSKVISKKKESNFNRSLECRVFIENTLDNYNGQWEPGLHHDKKVSEGISQDIDVLNVQLLEANPGAIVSSNIQHSEDSPKTAYTSNIQQLKVSPEMIDISNIQQLKDSPENAHSSNIQHLTDSPETLDSSNNQQLEDIPKYVDSSNIQHLKDSPETVNSSYIQQLKDIPKTADSSIIQQLKDNPETADSSNIQQLKDRSPETAESLTIQQFEYSPDTLDSSNIQQLEDIRKTADSSHIQQFRDNPETALSSNIQQLKDSSPETADNLTIQQFEYSPEPVDRPETTEKEEKHHNQPLEYDILPRNIDKMNNNNLENSLLESGPLCSTPNPKTSLLSKEMNFSFQSELNYSTKVTNDSVLQYNVTIDLPSDISEIIKIVQDNNLFNNMTEIENTKPYENISGTNDGGVMIIDNKNDQSQINQTNKLEVTANTDCDNSRTETSKSQSDSYLSLSSSDIGNESVNNQPSKFTNQPSTSTYQPSKTLNFKLPKNIAPVDLRKVTVPVSKKDNKRTAKKNFCPYCKTLQAKFARHLLLKHKEEPDVLKFCKLPLRNKMRLKIIDSIRKAGNCIPNLDPVYNTGTWITCRQSQAKFSNKPNDYIVCDNCKGFFSKKSVRVHYAQCNENHKNGAKQILISGRKMIGQIHERANEVLRDKVFPVLRDDEVAGRIAFDELVILVGNWLCNKHTQEHQYDMVRQDLRLLSRFIIAVQQIQPEVLELSSVFRPEYYDLSINVVKHLAGYNSNTRMFSSPTVATKLGTLLKQCVHIHMAECIKKRNKKAKKLAEDFLVLFSADYSTTINKKANEDRETYRREKKVILPSKRDIQCLYNYLKRQCRESLNILTRKFNKNAWKNLVEVTLIMTQVFNRRRPGDIERLLIAEYENRLVIDKEVHPDLYSKLSTEAKNYTQQYERIVTRGKLGRTVPILIDSFLIECIETIFKYKVDAGVSPNNKYVFGIPVSNTLSKKYMRACPLIRKFSNNCGAAIPSTLRATILRKHIATHTAMLRIEEDQVSDLANFMGHDKAIHKGVYRQPIPVTDITIVSRLLEAAMENGDEDINEDDNESSNDEATEDDIADTYKELIPQGTIVDDSMNSNSLPNNNSGSANNNTTDESAESPVLKKQSINFLTADGKKFAHPLHHLGKTEKDLPLIAIDSFRHMYLFPNYQDIEIPGKLKQFIKDLYSGKLHREFHYGTEAETENPTNPPESTFKKLAPSKNRYTLLSKDEL